MSNSNPLAMMLMLWTAVYLIAFVLGSFLLYCHREVQPIKFRGARIVFLSSLGCFVLTVTYAASYFRRLKGFDTEAYCVISGWLEWIFYPMMLLPYYLRAYRGLRIDRSVLKALRGRQRVTSHGSSEDDTRAGGGGEWHESKAVISSIMGWGSGEKKSSGDGAADEYENAPEFAGDLVYWERKAAPRLTEWVLLKFCFRCIFVVMIIKAVVDVICWLALGPPMGVHTAAFCTYSLVTRSGIYSTMHVLETVVLAHMVRSLKSDWLGARFYRKLEFGLFLTVWLMCCVGIGVFCVAVWIGAMPNVDLGDIIIGIMMIRNTLVFAISHFWVVVLTFDGNLAHQHALPLSSCQSLTSLASILQDINCMQYFREYLMSLSQVEILLCWMEIDLLRDVSPSTVALHAQRIWEKYLTAHAALGVTVSNAAHVSAQKRLEELRSITGSGPEANNLRCGLQEVVFDDVQRELFDQMKSVYGPFLVSIQGRACHERLERQEILQKALALCGMVKAPVDTVGDTYNDPIDDIDRFNPYSHSPSQPQHGSTDTEDLNFHDRKGHNVSQAPTMQEETKSSQLYGE
mmetsp:Transcript_13728/g.33561  ORF Transcript_13728/g.33561 Transcript_13728/m.33561 type:complete len:573 (+) Transcript_13728:154-1872(+)